mgnify:CR=1 FL=1
MESRKIKSDSNKHNISSKKYLERHEIICAKRICPHCKTYSSNRKNILARHIQQCKSASEQKPDVIKEEQTNHIITQED